MKKWIKFLIALGIFSLAGHFLARAAPLEWQMQTLTARQGSTVFTQGEKPSITAVGNRVMISAFWKLSATNQRIEILTNVFGASDNWTVFPVLPSQTKPITGDTSAVAYGNDTFYACYYLKDIDSTTAIDDRRLELWSRDTQNTITSTVIDEGTGGGEGTSPDTGTYCKMAIYKDGGIYISYYDEANKDVKYASKGPNDTVWTVRNIAGGSSDFGPWSSITLDPADGQLGASYYNATRGSVHDIHFTATGGSSGSRLDGTDSATDSLTSNVGAYNDIAVDRNGKTHVCYYDLVNHKFKYRKTGLPAEDLNNNSLGASCALAVYNDRVYVVYNEIARDDSRRLLMTSKPIDGGSFFTPSIIAGGEGAGLGPTDADILVNDYGIHVVFAETTASGGNLKYALVATSPEMETGSTGDKENDGDQGVTDIDDPNSDDILHPVDSEPDHLDGCDPNDDEDDEDPGCQPTEGGAPVIDPTPPPTPLPSLPPSPLPRGNKSSGGCSLRR